MKVGQAVALPITEEAGGELRLFTIAPRLTPHVRHREKYVDVPVSAHRAFVFNANGQPAHRVRTLRQFVSELEAHAGAAAWRGTSCAAISRAGSRDVFGDRALADELRALEQRYRTGSRDETLPEMASAVRGRYDLLDDELETVVPMNLPHRRGKSRVRARPGVHLPPEYSSRYRADRVHELLRARLPDSEQDDRL